MQCKLAKENGVDVLDVSRGNVITPANKYEIPPIDIPREFNIDNAARIRKETGMLTIGVGRLNEPGIAGLEAAIILKKRGHLPILCEATDQLGGQFLTAGMAPRKEEMKEAAQRMARKAERLGVEIRMNTKVTPEVIAEVKPHTVFNAIGSEPVIPKIQGVEKSFVVNSHDVLNGKVTLSGNIVVIGGGMVGMEVAEYLAERGCKVTDLEMMKEYCMDMGSARKFCVEESIARSGIQAVTSVTVKEIQDGKVIGEKDGEKTEYPCDCAVIAVGARSRCGEDLKKAAYENGCGYMVIGDAGMARRALNATREAMDAALTFDNPKVHADVSKEPVHWGRVGDPINPSMFDYYALSKVFSELAVFESGLKHWVSIRQTGQHPSAEEAGEEPIIWHQAPNNVLEWSTSIESGICMANLCEDWVPEEFWRKGYNLSSGAGYRLATWELMDINLEAFHMGLKDIMDCSMMAPYNFHGHYFSDSDLLDDILHFRCIPAEQYWGGVKDEMRRMAANPMIAAMFPSAEAMKAHNIEIGHKRMGTYWMKENNEENWIKAFFGYKEKMEAMPKNEDFDLHHPSEEVTYLDHGYDEEKGIENLMVEDLKKAAKFRGGEYLEETAPKDIYTPVKWKCADGHEFKMSVNAVLQGGHCCQDCLSHEWRYGKIAKVNPYYAQVWTPIRGEEDETVVPMEYSGYEVYQELKEKLDL